MAIRKLLFSSAVAALAFSFACDINKTTAQLNARTLMIATLLHTPAIEIRAEAVAGLPPNDSGFFIDAGFTIPSQTAALAFLGTRNGDGLQQSAPTPIVGAIVTVGQKGGVEHPLIALAGGTLQLTTQDDPTLSYVSNEDYLLTARANGQTYIATAAKVPALENIAQFRPAGRSFISLDAGSDFSFRRPDAPGGEERPLGFVLVFPLSFDGKQGPVPTYTSAPSEPLDLLKLVIAPSAWRTTTVTVPGSAFPDKDKNYVILLQSATLGRPDTDNLFIGSAIIAGTADVGIVKTY